MSTSCIDMHCRGAHVGMLTMSESQQCSVIDGRVEAAFESNTTTGCTTKMHMYYPGSNLQSSNVRMALMLRIFVAIHLRRAISH